MEAERSEITKTNVLSEQLGSVTEWLSGKIGLGGSVASPEFESI